MSEFDIVYTIKGTRVVRITLNEDAVLPLNWGEMSAPEKDEWLYSVTKQTRNLLEDIHHSEAVEVWESTDVKG